MAQAVLSHGVGVMNAWNTGRETMERDPVCGMTLQPGQEAADCRYGDHSYHFCSVECRQLFEKNPKEYTKETAHS
jgi:Cu+-exporting ATPase